LSTTASQDIQGALAWFKERYDRCDICPERCFVNRNDGKLGLCRLGTEGRVYKEFIHVGEEPEVCPTHVVYLAGCNFRCRYCSDLEQVLHPEGTPSTQAQWLASRIELRRSQGAKTVTFVGGSPDVQPHFVLDALSRVSQPVSVVWNSNLWLTEDSLERLIPFVDWFIPDVKYGFADCDVAQSGVQGSLEVLSRNLSLLKQHPVQVIARHLLLPGHLECCSEPVLEELARIWPGLRLNLMTAYRPFALWNEPSPLGKPLSTKEAKRVVKHLHERWSSSLDLRVDGRPLVHA